MGTIDCLTAEALRADDAWWRIYQDSFPANEQEPQDVIVESVLRGAGMAFRVRRQGVTVGLATTHLLKDPAAVFLVYLAVTRGERNRGAGGELLRGAWEAGETRLREQGLKPLGLVWEVDPPQAAESEEEVSQRRIAYFRRRGGQLLERPYLQPPVNGIAAVPMRLMFLPAEGEGIPAAETVEGLVRAIYFEKYGAVNGIERPVLEGLLNRRPYS